MFWTCHKSKSRMRHVKSIFALNLSLPLCQWHAYRHVSFWIAPFVSFHLFQWSHEERWRHFFKHSPICMNVNLVWVELFLFWSFGKEKLIDIFTCAQPYYTFGMWLNIIFYWQNLMKWNNIAHAAQKNTASDWK